MLVTFKVSVVVAAVVVIIIDVVSGCSVSVVGIIVVGFIVVVVNIVVVRSKTLVVSGSFVVDGLSVVVVVVLQYDDNLRVQTFKRNFGVIRTHGPEKNEIEKFIINYNNRTAVVISRSYIVQINEIGNVFKHP